MPSFKWLKQRLPTKPFFESSESQSRTTFSVYTTMKINKDRMQCMEILGGNLATNRAYEAVGLDIYVHSAPYLSSKVGGGDVYYLTSCASGRINRLLLADISGHGEEAAELAGSLKSLLQRNVNRISQSGFVEEMNQEFQRVSPADRLATAVVATYFEPQKRLALGMAGHPNPLIYIRAEQRWHKVDQYLAMEETRFQHTEFRNMPLGTVDESAYPTRNFQVKTGDMFLLYTDAYVESITPEGRLLGVDGLVDLLNEIPSTEPETCIQILRERVQSLAPDNLNDDDATLILGCFTKTKASLSNSLSAPFRLMRKVKDETSVEALCESC